MRTDPRPTPSGMGVYYPADYGPYVSSRTHATSPAWQRLARRLFETRAETIPSLPVGRLFEIGCAAGGFLRRMEKQGWSVEGLEFSATAAAHAQAAGLKVRAGALEQANDPDGRFDLIVGWMVLEHLHEPLAALRRLRGWIAPDGWLAISVPDAGGWEFRTFGADWYALHLPNHLTHFTPTTLTRLLAEAGWRVERITHQRNLLNLFPSLGYRRQSRHADDRLTHWLIHYPERGGVVKAVLYPLAVLLAAFGQTGRMTVWARPS
ncbi:Class I SAM-dependent methyltransferase [Gammaproteobacteria bacterium]